MSAQVFLKGRAEVFLPDDNGDQEAGQDKENADLGHVRHGTVEAAYNEACKPCNDQVYHEDVPRLGREISMSDTVHLHHGVGKDETHGCASEDPGQPVPIATKEA